MSSGRPRLEDGCGRPAQARGATAPVDPDIAALWERIETDYHANQGVIVESLHAKGALMPGLDVDRATDILWTLNHPNPLAAPRRGSGWPPEDYEQWTGDVACRQLLERAQEAPCGRRGRCLLAHLAVME